MTLQAEGSDELDTIAADLPETYATRWNAARKAAVVRAVQNGVITQRKALTTYRLSRSELASWQASFAKRGVGGLTAKRLSGQRETTS